MQAVAAELSGAPETSAAALERRVQTVVWISEFQKQLLN
jgi:hypothetical protein